MKKYTLHSGFTLVELIVAISIFSIMMVGVLSIFLFSSQMSTRVELNRVMQENVKNVFENIAESVRSQHIIEAADANCASPDPIDPLKMTESLVPGGKLCIRNTLLNQTEYFIGHKLGNNWVRVTNIDECAEFTKASLNGEAENDDNICRVLKNDGTRIFPLTNNFVAIESLDFFVNNDKIPKVYMRMILRPAARKGLAVNILDNNRMYVQTSISERFIATQ